MCTSCYINIIYGMYIYIILCYLPVRGRIKEVAREILYLPAQKPLRLQFYRLFTAANNKVSTCKHLS